jgi:hypothetical protein
MKNDGGLAFPTSSDSRDLELSFETATIEHVVAITSGGTNHLSNKALACEPHNRQAGHLSAREKFELAIKIRTTPKEAAA